MVGDKADSRTGGKREAERVEELAVAAVERDGGDTAINPRGCGGMNGEFVIMRWAAKVQAGGGVCLCRVVSRTAGEGKGEARLVGGGVGDKLRVGEFSNMRNRRGGASVFCLPVDIVQLRGLVFYEIPNRGIPTLAVSGRRIVWGDLARICDDICERRIGRAGKATTAANKAD